jgi:hypothetical protein
VNFTQLDIPELNTTVVVRLSQLKCDPKRLVHSHNRYKYPYLTEIHN